MTLELSRNWKKIQPTLKQVVKDTVKQKRKVAPSERQLNAQAKRRRLERKLVTNSTTPETSRNRNRMETTETRQIIPAGSSVSFELWAEDNDISAKDLAEAYGSGLRDKSILATRPDEINGGLLEDVAVGKYVGIDCEMVGVGGIENRSVLARVSIVNFHGTQVYDSFVKPKEFVTDWRTHISGVSSKNMATARNFEEVQRRVAAILKDRVLVGHAIENDLRVLMLGHPKRDIRDTSRFSGFRKHSAGRTPSLRKLIKEILGMDIQDGVHSSIEDARATMLLFRCHKSAFDVEHAKNFPASKSGAKKSESRAKSKRKKAKKTR